MQSLLTDLRYAFRQMRNAPAFAAVVVILIGIGIAANATIFTLVDALLLRKLPVRDPEELVRLIEHHPPLPDSGYFDYGYLQLLREHSTSYSDVIGEEGRETTLTVDGIAEFVQIGLVTENYFEMLGVKPALGGLPRTAEAVILSDQFWRKRFAGNGAVIGRPIQLNGHPFTIAGVMAPEFHGTTVELNPDMRVPAKAVSQLGGQQFSSFELVARLKPQVSIERALSESMSLADSWAPELAKRYPRNNLENLKFSKYMQVQPIGRGVSILRNRFAGALELLMGGVGLVLLMVCSNVAGLLLERATARERETAVRLAVGASQGRLIRQWLTESLVLAMWGGVLGVALAWLAMPVLSSMIPPLRSRGGDLLMLDPNFGLNWRVIVFSFAACTLAAVGAGFAPAWRAGRFDLSLSLRATRSSSRVEGGITILQIALCTLLLVEGGVFARTLQKMRTMEVGFDVQHVATFTLQREAGKDAGKSSFGDLLLREAEQLPGVRGAAYGGRGLLRGTGLKFSVGLPGERVPESEYLNTSMNSGSLEYFDTMGMRIVAGRGFARTDGVRAEIGRVIVNQAFVRRFFPGVDPIGKLFGGGTVSELVKANSQIIGVVSDAQYRSLREPVPPVCYSVFPGSDVDSSTILHVRTSGDPSALIAPVSELVRKVAKGWSIREVNLLRDEEERSIWRERLVAQLAIGFAAVAGLLAAIGLYGTLAYYVSRNQRGIGIRVAIGAARSNIVELLAGRVVRLIASGAVLGLAASFALSGWVRALLFGVAPSDPVSIGAALSLLAGIAVVALMLPAWRATRIDPAITLREE